MLRHAFQTGQKFIPRRRIQLFQSVDLCGQFIFQLVQPCRFFAVHLQLQIHKIFHIFLQISRISFHHLFKRRTLFIFDQDRPFSVHLTHFFHTGDVKPRRFDSRRIERLVKHICLWMIFFKNLNDSVLALINFFVLPFYDQFFLFQFHSVRLLL